MAARSIADHHACGILPRWRQADAVKYEMPSSLASICSDGQRDSNDTTVSGGRFARRGALGGAMDTDTVPFAQYQQ